MADQPRNDVQGGLTEEEKRSNVIRLAFGGSPERFEEFCRTVRRDIPDGTVVVLRGSAVTGQRWKDGAPFDADGPGTSDLDLTLVGDEAVALFRSLLRSHTCGWTTRLFPVASFNRSANVQS